MRIHSHQPTIEQVEVRAAEAAREVQQLAGTIAVVTEPITEEDSAQEIAEAGESSVAASSFAEEPQTGEVMPAAAG